MRNEVDEYKSGKTSRIDEALDENQGNPVFKYIVPIMTLLTGITVSLGATYLVKFSALIVSVMFAASGILILFGLNRRVKNIRLKPLRRMNFNIYSGAWLIILSVIMYFKSELIRILLPSLLGSFLLLASVIKLVQMFRVRAYWYWFLLGAYISAVFGITAVAGKTDTMLYAGIFFAAEGVIDIILFMICDIGAAVMSKMPPIQKKTAVIVRICAYALLTVAAIVGTYFAFAYLI